jgi:hypothetical protein
MKDDNVLFEIVRKIENINKRLDRSSTIDIGDVGDGYDEIQFTSSAGKTPAANFPTWELMTTTCSEYAFSVNDHIDAPTNEIPHWWLLASNGDAHIHFSTKAAQSSGSNRYAKFSVQFAIAAINGAWVEPAALVKEYTIPTGTAAKTHLYLDLGDIDLSAYHFGDKIKCDIKRIAATSGTEYADDVYIHDVGVHLYRNRFGSPTEIP